MHGNVWEWCADHWHDHYEGAPISGSAWMTSNNSARLLRGGSWIYTPDHCRSAFRYHRSHDYQDHRSGFRVVCV